MSEPDPNKKVFRKHINTCPDTYETRAILYEHEQNAKRKSDSKTAKKKLAECLEFLQDN